MENDSFYIKKIAGSMLELSAKLFFSLDKYLFKKYGLKNLFLLFNI